jgi:hypothetical protein
MRYDILRSTARDARTPVTASFRGGFARRMPGVPGTRATSPRCGATRVRTSPGRLTLLAQSGRSCFGEGLC